MEFALPPPHFFSSEYWVGLEAGIVRVVSGNSVDVGMGMGMDTGTGLR